MADIKIYGVLTSGTGAGVLARASQISVTGLDQGASVQEVLETIAQSQVELPEGIVIDMGYVHTDNNYDDTARGIVDSFATNYQTLLDSIGTKASITDAMMKADFISANDAAIVSDKLPTIAIDKMGDTYDGSIIALSTGIVYTANGNLYRYQNDGSGLILGELSTRVIYCNKNTNKLYRWTGLAWQPVGGDNDMSYDAGTSTLTIN